MTDIMTTWLTSYKNKTFSTWGSTRVHMHCCTLLSFPPSFSAFCFFHFSLGFSPPESVQLSKRPHNTESHKSFYFPCVSDDGVVDNLLYPLSRCKHETRDQKVCFLPHPCFYNISNIFVQAAHPRHHTRRSNPNSRDVKILEKKRKKISLLDRLK